MQETPHIFLNQKNSLNLAVTILQLHIATVPYSKTNLHFKSLQVSKCWADVMLSHMLHCLYCFVSLTT